MKFFLSFFILLFVAACTTNGNLTSSEQASVAVKKPQKSILIDVEKEQEVPDLSDLQSDPGSYENLWLKLAEGFEFSVPDNTRIAKQRESLLKRPNYLAKVSKRAEPFLYLIIEQLEARNLPLDLALLPVVESAFDPFAYSHSSASGLWQFMPGTADRFGLKQDWWYDGRRDVYASTEAALKYMEILHQYLDQDWLYALAAYNSGEGRVERAVRLNKKQNKPADYWHLSLPRETQEYVPKLLALVDILRNHEKYGIELPVIENRQVLAYVDTESQLDLAYAAELAELSVAEMQLLNPAFNNWATSPDGPHKLLIPTETAEQFSQQLAKLEENKRVRWSRYTVQAGDSLGLIAEKNKTTVNVLKQVNDLDSSLIKIGRPLLIPVASKSQQDHLYSQAQRFERQKTTANKGKSKAIYTVVEGDTLWDISRNFNVTVKEISKWNTLNTKNTLRLGQKLTVWHTKSNSDNNTRRLTYKVRAGDSLIKIASKFKVKTADLVRWNGLHKEKYIQPGQQLQVYVKAANYPA
ncbi:LysM peptidoglycan-binding domain-containing protein [Psychromonas sp.]|uniref:lytic transglycosylase n=1 Tax=Psychromonas sp. TaxID=1884585 RepID=UPI003568C5BC